MNHLGIDSKSFGRRILLVATALAQQLQLLGRDGLGAQIHGKNVRQLLNGCHLWHVHTNKAARQTTIAQLLQWLKHHNGYEGFENEDLDGYWFVLSMTIQQKLVRQEKLFSPMLWGGTYVKKLLGPRFSSAIKWCTFKISIVHSASSLNQTMLGSLMQNRASLT